MTTESILLIVVISLGIVGIALFWFCFDQLMNILKELLKGKDE